MTAPERDPADTPSSPDLTESVMRRLGLGDVTAREAKRRRRRRTLLRLAVCALFVAAGVVVVSLVSSPPEPSGPTIPSAVRHDLAQHGQTIDRTVRSIRGLGRQFAAPPAPAAPADDGSGAAVDEPAAEPSV